MDTGSSDRPPSRTETKPPGHTEALAAGAHQIELTNHQGALQIDPSELVGLARRVLEREGVAASDLSIVLVDNAAIHALNRQHLGHDWPTDVISFALSEPDEPELSGELIVSAEMALEAAQEVGIDPRDELALYIVHGLLHLRGFDDLNEADAARMRERENLHLSSEGIPNPFAMTGRKGEPPSPDSASRGGEWWPA